MLDSLQTGTLVVTNRVLEFGVRGNILPAGLVCRITNVAETSPSARVLELECLHELYKGIKVLARIWEVDKLPMLDVIRWRMGDF